MIDWTVGPRVPFFTSSFPFSTGMRHVIMKRMSPTFSFLPLVSPNRAVAFHQRIGCHQSRLGANFSELRKGEVRRILLLGTSVNKGNGRTGAWDHSSKRLRQP